MKFQVGKGKKFLLLILITLLQIIIISSSYSNVIFVNASNLIVSVPTIYESISLNKINSNFNSQELIKYNPVNNVSGIGSSFTAKDILNVYDQQSLNLTYNAGNENFEDRVDFDQAIIDKPVFDFLLKKFGS